MHIIIATSIAALLVALGYIDRIFQLHRRAMRQIDLDLTEVRISLGQRAERIKAEETRLLKDIERLEQDTAQVKGNHSPAPAGAAGRA